MSAPKTKPDEQWLAKWLDSVADGSSKMSQRKLASIEKKVGLAKAAKAARKRGLHLLRLKDDHGTDVIAASVNAFHIVC